MLARWLFCFCFNKFTPVVEQGFDIENADFFQLLPDLLLSLLKFVRYVGSLRLSLTGGLVVEA